MADFSGSDALIIKDHLRTEQYDSMQLNGKCANVYVLLLQTVGGPSIGFSPAKRTTECELCGWRCFARCYECTIIAALDILKRNINNPLKTAAVDPLCNSRGFYRLRLRAGGLPFEKIPYDR